MNEWYEIFPDKFVRLNEKPIAKVCGKENAHNFGRSSYGSDYHIKLIEEEKADENRRE